ncbi:MAG: hypothetical protein IKR97_04280 [Eubacterium sp.]|nr:hypothetical protein [Eubacterium sp.]
MAEERNEVVSNHQTPSSTQRSTAHHHSSSSHSSHRSSSHSSHKHKKHKKSSSTKRKSAWRSVFSFLLFLCISAAVVLFGMRMSVLNVNTAARIFTNNEYLSGLHSDVYQYSKDLCLKYGIPEESVKDSVSFSNIRDIQIAYISGQFDMDEMYTSSTYLDNIKEMKSQIVKTTGEAIKENKLSVDEKVKKTALNDFANEITDYAKAKVEFSYIEDLKSILNVSNPVLNVLIILFTVLAIAFLLLTISFSDKKYRSFRAVCYSIFGSAGINFVLVLLVGIVSIFKDFLIYPSYLCQSVMTYIKTCVLTFTAQGIVLFLAATMVSALVWRLKRENN